EGRGLAQGGLVGDLVVDHAEAGRVDDQKQHAQHQAGEHDAPAYGFAEGHARQDPDLLHSPPSFPTGSMKITSSAMGAGVISKMAAPRATRQRVITGTGASSLRVIVSFLPSRWISRPQRSSSAAISAVRPE